MAAEQGLLHGNRVLDLSLVGPASRCAGLLADLGAQVTKIVPPAGSGRHRPPVHAYGAGRGTERVVIDLRSDSGRTRFLELARDVDVVLDGFRPGTARALGIDHAAVSAINPSVVYASMSGYGRTGPMAGWAGHDLNYQAVSGILSLQERNSEGRPALPGATVADSAGGGMQAALAVVAALLHRANTGQGSDLDVSASDGMLALMSLTIDEHLATTHVPGPRGGLLTGQYACYDLYTCADQRWLSVAAIEGKFFENLCRLLEVPELSRLQYELEHQEHVRRTLAEIFVTRDRDGWVETLAGHDTCVAPVLEVTEVAQRARADRRTLMVVDPASGEKFDQLGPVIAGARSFDEPVIAMAVVEEDPS